MQTFLPYSDFKKCAEVLDFRRLNKQIVECHQILDALINGNSRWINHPATKMWKGCETTLVSYVTAMYTEFTKRGGTLSHKSYWKINELMKNDIHKFGVKKPSWRSNEQLHSSHRANLLRKDPVHYGQFGWTEEPREGYWWPTKELLEV